MLAACSPAEDVPGVQRIVTVLKQNVRIGATCPPPGLILVNGVVRGAIVDGHSRSTKLRERDTKMLSDFPSFGMNGNSNMAPTFLSYGGTG
jgi:hypothetical protein